MVLPLIFGSMAKIIFDMETVPQNINIINLTLGFISAFLSGIFACKWMINFVKKSKLKYFSYYCLLIGGATMFYGLF